MSEVTSLTLPAAGSRRTTSRLLLVLGCVLAVALVCLVLAAVVATSRPTWSWLLGGIGAALVPWVLDVLVTALGRRGRLRLRTVGSATEVVGSAWSRPVDVAAAVVLLVALVGSLLSLVDTSTGTPGLDAAAPVAVLALLALLAFGTLLSVVARRRRRSRLRLHAGGLEVSGPDGRGDFEWDALTRLRPSPLAAQTVDGAWVPLQQQELRSDPALVARLVEHYRTHPRERDELADGRAVERARTDRLGPLGA